MHSLVSNASFNARSAAPLVQTHSAMSDLLKLFSWLNVFRVLVPAVFTAIVSAVVMATSISIVFTVVLLAATFTPVRSPSRRFQNLLELPGIAESLELHKYFVVLDQAKYVELTGSRPASLTTTHQHIDVTNIAFS